MDWILALAVVALAVLLLLGMGGDYRGPTESLYDSREDRERARMRKRRK